MKKVRNREAAILDLNKVYTKAFDNFKNKQKSV